MSAFLRANVEGNKTRLQYELVCLNNIHKLVLFSGHTQGNKKRQATTYSKEVRKNPLFKDQVTASLFYLLSRSGLW